MKKNNSAKPQKLHTDDVFALLSDNQWRYVTAMVENPSFSKKDGAEHIGMLPDTVYRWPPYVNDAIEQARANVHDAALTMRKQAVLKAIAVKLKLLDSEDEGIRSKVASEIIEWELGKATQRNEVTGADGKAIQHVSVSVPIHSVNDANEILQELEQLGVLPDGTRTAINNTTPE